MLNVAAGAVWPITVGAADTTCTVPLGVLPSSAVTETLTVPPETTALVVVDEPSPTAFALYGLMVSSVLLFGTPQMLALSGQKPDFAMSAAALALVQM